MKQSVRIGAWDQIQDGDLVVSHSPGGYIFVEREAPLPTAQGSIVAPISETDRSEAFLIGFKWVFASGIETDPAQWFGGWRLKRDAAIENPLFTNDVEDDDEF